MLEDQLRAAGYRIVPFGEAAEIGVIHTCVVTREAEAKSRKIIRRFIRANPAAITAVIGCYAQTAAEAIAGIPGVSLVLGNDAKMQLAEKVGALSDAAQIVLCPQPERHNFTVPFTDAGPPITRRVNLKIQDGCDCMCSYCYVPFARGPSRSRRIEDALDEARILVRRGAKELVLTGVNIGKYHDKGQGLPALIDRLDALRPRPRIRISSIERTHCPVELLERMAEPEHALVPHLHIPIQSGAEAVLRAMNRPCMPAEYLGFMNEAVVRVPDIGLGADVMVGFPGETDEDFNATRDLVRRSPLFYLHVFQYSERPGVAAAKLLNVVAGETMHMRSKILLDIAREKKLIFQRKWVGRRVKVLFESQKEGYWRGHAGNYLEIVAKSRANLENTFATVETVEIKNELLVGVIVDDQ